MINECGRQDKLPVEARLERAREILGEKDLLGPEAVAKAFGIELSSDQIPPMPYSDKDLELAKGLGEMLVLTVNKDNEGNSLTMARMLELTASEFTDPETGKPAKLLYHQKQACSSELENDAWYKDEPFYKEQAPLLRWRLVGKKPLLMTLTPDYGGQAKETINYPEQTKILRDHLKSIGALSDDEEAECSDETLDKITKTMSSDLKKAAKMLSELKINQNHRRTPAEILYDILLFAKNNNERLLTNVYDWSNTVTSGGGLVDVGDFDVGGVGVSRWYPVSRDGGLGVASLR